MVIRCNFSIEGVLLLGFYNPHFLKLGIDCYNSANFVRRCESANTMVSFLWWIVGFYLVFLCLILHTYL